MSLQGILWGFSKVWSEVWSPVLCAAGGTYMIQIQLWIYFARFRLVWMSLLGHPLNSSEETTYSCILTALALEKLLFWTASWADEVILMVTRPTYARGPTYESYTLFSLKGIFALTSLGKKNKPKLIIIWRVLHLQVAVLSTYFWEPCMVIKVSYSAIGHGNWTVLLLLLALVLPNKGQCWGALIGYLGSYF